MAKLSYENIVSYLLERFPEYKNSAEYFVESNKDLPHVFLGNLCLMVFNEFNSKNDGKLAERLLKISDQIFNDPNSEEKVIELFAVEVLENLVESRDQAILAKKMLHGASIDLLHKTLKYYHAEEFLKEFYKTDHS